MQFSLFRGIEPTSFCLVCLFRDGHPGSDFHVDREADIHDHDLVAFPERIHMQSVHRHAALNDLNIHVVIVLEL